jgi:RNA polymerase sigma factor (sigma-70 family)
MNVPDGLPELGAAPRPAPADGPGDGELLGRFARDHDEEAFAALVWRHGPMVFGVCLRVLREPHDAEDAFQAAFLALARRAGAVGRPELLAKWLYGVAHRTARNARARAARRRRHEAMAAPMSAAGREPETAREELRTLLDRELQRLPEKYRTPLVLCYLEGKTNAEAARQLGWPPGSMSARLARGRELLRERLRALGVACPAGALLALLGRGAVAAPARLCAAAVQAALALGTGKAAAAISPAVFDLMESTLKTLAPRRRRAAAVLAVLLAALLLAGLGAGAAAATLGQGGPPGARPASAAEPARPAPPSQPADAPPHSGYRHPQPEAPPDRVLPSGGGAT